MSLCVMIDDGAALSPVVQRGEEKMSSVVESWRKGTGGRATGWRVGEEKSVSDPFFI